MSGIDSPEVAARKMHPRGMAMESDMRASAYAIRGRDAEVSRALSAALGSSDPFPALRSILSSLSPDPRPCSRCGDPLGPEEHDGTCDGSTGPEGSVEPARAGKPGFPFYPLHDGVRAEDFMLGGDLAPPETTPELRARVERLRRTVEMVAGPPAYLAATEHALAAAEAELARREGPVTEPGPTEHVDRDLRYRYDGPTGCLVLPSEHGDRCPILAHPLGAGLVRGLRVRITYVFSPADREAAEDVAVVWRERLKERGAKRVEMVGEESK